jgi:hypothetical protein
LPDNRAAEYRRLARECLTLVPTIGAEKARFLMIEMARVWTRLADEHEGVLAPPGLQQQQCQPAPKKDTETE